MQQFVNIQSSETLTDSRQDLLNNFFTLMSNSSGATFPTTNLQVGMFCFRTDLLQLFQLQSLLPTWTLIFDLSKTAVNQEYVDSQDATKVNTADVVSTATANKILRLDTNGNLPANISGNANTATTAGAVAWANVTAKPANFTPPIATGAVLGGVKAGAGLSIAGDGTASVSVSVVPAGCQLFTAGGTFTVPAGVTSVLVSLSGGGGGGGGAGNYQSGGGGGGAAGVLLAQVTVTPNQSITVTVGGGGGAGGSNQNGGAGGTSSFGGYVSAAGGGGGYCNQNPGGSGGFGGQTGGHGQSGDAITSAGSGGGSLFGSGGISSPGQILAPAGYGAGGYAGGGASGSSGAAGTAGMVLVQW